MKEKIISYKGFDKDLKCRDFQYKVGKSYSQKGKISCCNNGFHACDIPLSVFNHYSPAKSRFAIVEQSGELDKELDKIASSKIKIEKELSLDDLIKAQIEWVHSNLDPEQKNSQTGDQGAATQTGYRGASTQTGYRGAATQTGNQGAATQTGDRGAATQTGCRGAATQTGNQGASTQTGDQGAATQTGYQGAATQTGDQGASTQTGYQGAATQTGYRGASTQTGYQGAATQTGDRGAATQTGCRGAATVMGKSSVAMAMGYLGKARAVKGSCIVVCDYKMDIFGNRYIDNIYSAKVGNKILDTKIKPNTWYWFENGKLMSSK